MVDASRENAPIYGECVSGRSLDRETNLHYNYYRDYDPSTGRYIQSDPIGLGGGINTYAYVSNQPTRYIDPTGEVALVDDAAIWAAVGAGAILMSPPGQKAIKDIAKSIGDLCKTDDPCAELQRQIRDIAGKLRTKIKQQEVDQWSLYTQAYSENLGGALAGKGTWVGHDAQITGLKTGLARKVAEAQMAGCPVPLEVLQLLSTPNPTKPIR